MSHPFTTADADRLLGLGDQLLEDWKQAADMQRFGEVGPEYVERRDEWDAIRPMLVQAPAMHKLLSEAFNFWGAQFADPHAPVSGAEVVDWLAGWLVRVRPTLEAGTPPTPSLALPEALRGPL